MILPSPLHAVRQTVQRLLSPAAPTFDWRHPERFEAVEACSGPFGRWTVDGDGLPAYRYEMDQYNDLRAQYPNSEGFDMRTHWHVVGNDRINALATNDGPVQAYLSDRGGVWLNWIAPREADLNFFQRLLRTVVRIIGRIWDWLRALWRRLVGSPPPASPPRGVSSFEPTALARIQPVAREERYAYGGGYGYVDDGREAWATAYRYRPSAAKTERIFGMGYFETSLTYHDVEVRRRIYAPPGDDPVLLADVTFANLGAAPVDLRYYEYWDVNVIQLQLQWGRTGLLAAYGNDERERLNKRFTPSIALEAGETALRFHQEPPDDAPAPETVSNIDWYPADVWLADLSARPDAHYTNRMTFFGAGGAAQPDAVVQGWEADNAASAPGPMPFCMVLRHKLHLEPQGQTALRFGYGTSRPGETPAWLEKYHVAAEGKPPADQWRESLAYFGTPDEPVLQREMAWHAYNLLAITSYHDYYQAHVTPQGSAYLYLHGADGAPRDQALFVLPLTYLRPDLARENIQLLMRLQSATTGALPYSFMGYGYHDGAGIHEAPSDLDIFFLLALGEYLAATGDLALLAEEIPYYPTGASSQIADGTTGLDHVRSAVKHLLEQVSTGENGLIRISDGDWSDSIVFETSLRSGTGLLGGVSYEQSCQHGESIPNTQMALYVLPLLADILAPIDPALAATLREPIARWTAALKPFWRGEWFVRAVLRDRANRPVLIDKDRINLESQVWALISGLAHDMQVETGLVEAIARKLDRPSPIGATLLEAGMVWPAIGQLLTWGYSVRHPHLAWQALKRQTFAAHCDAFPNVWFNTWSGPDGINGRQQPNPGGTWASPATPMTDFPVMNANQDAMALLGLLRVCGIHPTGDGLRIAPQAPPERFVLDLPLLRLEVEPGRIAGEYRAVVDGTRTLHIRIPDGVQAIQASVDGATLAEGVGGSEVALPLTFHTGQRVPFAVTWS